MLVRSAVPARSLTFRVSPPSAALPPVSHVSPRIVQGEQPKETDFMHKLAILAAALVPLGIAGAAQATSLGRPCTAAPEAQWLSLDTLKAKAEAAGYRVQKAKLKAACGEIYALDRNGTRVELFVDPTSGQIVGSQ
jgi:hypothetical protein